MIKRATIEDLPKVLDMYMTALDEIHNRGDCFKPDPTKCWNHVYQSFLRAPCLILEDNGEIIGIAGLTTVAPIYTNMIQLCDYMFYIKPECRSLRRFMALCKAAQAVADEMKLPLRVEHLVTGCPERHLKLLKMVDCKLGALVGIYGGS